MTLLQSLRDRWGGGIRPSVAIRHDDGAVARWDGAVENAPGYVVSFEGFGISGTMFIGRTPAIQPEGQAL